MSTPVERVLEALAAHGCAYARAGGGYEAQCPAHEDKVKSLSIKEGHAEKALLKCHAGCDLEKILRSLRLEPWHLFVQDDKTPMAAKAPLGRVVESYVYTDEQGNPLSRNVRYHPKTFRQERYEDGSWVSGLGQTRRVLYAITRLFTTMPGERIWIVEGEKDADRLNGMGQYATSAPMGAGKWSAEWNHTFQDRRTVIVQDKDAPGRKHARAIAASLRKDGVDVVIVEALVGKDVSDHLDAGHTLAELVPVSETDIPDRLAVQSWTAFRDNTPEHIDYLVTDLIPRGSLVFVAGAPKAGKSWIGVELSLAVATGSLFLGRFHVPRQGNVLHFALEGNRSAMRTRIGAIARSHRVNPDDPAALVGLNLSYKPTGLDLMDASWASDVAEGVTGASATMVVVDVLRAAAPGLREDGQGSTDFAIIRSHLQPILAAGVTVVILHHNAKLTDQNKGRAPGDKMAGSGALFGAADLVISLRSKDKLAMRCDLQGRDLATPDSFGVYLMGAPSGEWGGFRYADELRVEYSDSIPIGTEDGGRK